ncbi:MAG: MBL fold metallo-hydrolase [Bacteroidales bacterium]
MKITLYGAAGNVTGSAYFVQTTGANLLVDFGAFQGEGESEQQLGDNLPFSIKNLNSVLLTHGHLDHCGRLPFLTKHGYKNPVYATEATIELARLILLDSVKIQKSETERHNRKRLKNGLPPEEMQFSEEDVDKVLELFTPVDYNKDIEIAPGCVVMAHEAGHILGSVSYRLTVTENGKLKTVVFSGDIGPYNMAIVNDPFPFTKADLVFMESTYGDRDHRSHEETMKEGTEVVRKAILNKSKIIVPAFAVGRTQQLLYSMAKSVDLHELDEIPIYLDSPMGIEASKIYAKHIELYDEEALALFKKGVLRGDLSRIHVSVTVEESKALNGLGGPCMIIAGSGMCNAGRVLHHLRHNLSNPETAVMITGYQGKGTLGRKLIEGEEKVHIFGEEIEVKAKVYSLNGLSAHAGQSDLLKWFSALAPSKPILVLSHGEDRAREPLAEIIREKYGINPVLPEYREVIEI